MKTKTKRNRSPEFPSFPTPSVLVLSSRLLPSRGGASIERTFTMDRARLGALFAAGAFVMAMGSPVTAGGSHLEEAMARLRASRTALSERVESSETLERKLDLREESQMPEDVPGIDTIPGDAAVVRPKRRKRLRRLRVTLDSVPLRSVESQGAAKPNSFLSIGRRIDTSVSFLPGGDIRENSEEKVGAMAVFLGQPSLHLYGIRVRALSYTGSTGMRMDGRTPPVGRVDILQVREVGDVRGKVVHSREGISFRLGGKETVIPIDLETEKKYRYMAVFSMKSEPGVASSVNIPVSTEGTYTALALDPKTLIPRGGSKPSYDAAVQFEYKPDPDVIRPHFDIEGDFLAQLERYLVEHPEAGEIPLKLLLE
jgi:hypothetical protein